MKQSNVLIILKNKDWENQHTKMKAAGYIIVLIVMFAFLLLSPFKWLIVVVGIFFIITTVIRYLFWRNEFDYQR